MIVVAKFNGGVEIIGKLVKEVENVITIAHPLQIVYRFTGDSPVPNVSFTRYMMFAEATQFDFQKHDFVIVARAVSDIVPVYTKLIKTLEIKNTVEGMAVKGTPADEMHDKGLYTTLLEYLDAARMTKQ